MRLLMDLVILSIILVILFIGFTSIYFLLRREVANLRTSRDDTTLLAWLKSMQETIDRTQKAVRDAMQDSSSDVTRTLQSNTRQLNERLDAASHVIGDLKKQVGEMSEVGRGIKSLQEFLQSPKLRGGIGEEILADMIGQTFPKHSFHLQYTFLSGVKADAVVKTEAGLLPIDAKFPMENFRKMHRAETTEERTAAKKEFLTDIRKHASDIGKKYILPEEGTLDFALMYIPSESVYYEAANSAEFMDHAKKLRVYPVSPSTLYAHLQLLLLSFQGKELESKSRDIFRVLRAIQKEYEKLDEHLGILGKHITNANNTMSSVHHVFISIGQKLNQTTLVGRDSQAQPQLPEDA